MEGCASPSGVRRAAWPVLVALAAALAAAAAPGAPRETRDAELAEVRERIGELERRLATLDHERPGLEARLEALGLEVELQERRVEESQLERRTAEEGLATASRELETLDFELDASRRALGRRLFALARLERRGLALVVLSVRPERLLAGVRSLRYLAVRAGERIRDFRTRSRLVAERREELVARRDRVTETLRQESSRLAALEEARRRQALVLAAFERERLRLERRAAELTAKAEKLAAFLAYLADRERGSPGGRAIQEFRGALDWPAEGEVLQAFGPRRDARYATEVPHNGLELGTRKGTPVRAIFPGVVVFAADFEGIGPTVVLHHEGRVFTLYAGLDELLVAKGAVVSLRDQLGRAGERLYFEIRERNQPDDPASWLR